MRAPFHNALTITAPPPGFCVSAHSKRLSASHNPFRMSTCERVLQLGILKDLRHFLSDAALCRGQTQRWRVRLGRNRPDAEGREASGRPSKPRRCVMTNTDEDSTEAAGLSSTQLMLLDGNSNRMWKSAARLCARMQPAQ